MLFSGVGHDGGEFAPVSLNVQVSSRSTRLATSCPFARQLRPPKHFQTESRPTASSRIPTVGTRGALEQYRWMLPLAALALFPVPSVPSYHSETLSTTARLGDALSKRAAEPSANAIAASAHARSYLTIAIGQLSS
jgi:hypothetical protein